MLHVLAAALMWPSEPIVMRLAPYLTYHSTIKAAVAGVDGTFLFDTGEGVTAITPDFARRIGCRPWGQIIGFRMSGERVGGPHCDNLTFAVGGRDLSVPSAIILDTNALMGPGVPPVDGAIGLDAFAGLALTIVPRSCIILESVRSLDQRVTTASPLQIRIVRDAEGVALAVDGAVPTSAGVAWMELDGGNGGSTVITNHVAPLFGLPTDQSTPRPVSFKLEDGIEVRSPVRTRDLIMDGDIGARFLNDWMLTLDLERDHSWLQPRQEGTCGTRPLGISLREGPR